MARELMTSKNSGTPVPPAEKSFFEIYAEKVLSQSSIVGKLLRFSKGDWLLGQDNEELPAGTKFVANVEQLMVGWVKWVDSRPVEQEMGLLAEGYTPRKRDELGDNDESRWETDGEGKPRDPWQFQNQVLMKPVGKKYSTDNAITFVTGSKGGFKCLANLMKTYAQEIRTHNTSQFPIVVLGVESYEHPNREYGRIKNPTMAVDSWEKAALFEEPEVNQVEEEAPKARKRK